MSKEKQIDGATLAVLSCYRNKYYADGNNTEQGIVANAINDVLPTLVEFKNGCYRKQEWISVDERLPKQLTHVIVCDEDGTVGEAFCYKEGRFEWIDSEEIAFVTHWMPLPEPPKMKGGAE